MEFPDHWSIILLLLATQSSKLALSNSAAVSSNAILPAAPALESSSKCAETLLDEAVKW